MNGLQNLNEEWKVDEKAYICTSFHTSSWAHINISASAKASAGIGLGTTAVDNMRHCKYQHEMIQTRLHIEWDTSNKELIEKYTTTNTEMKHRKQLQTEWAHQIKDWTTNIIVLTRFTHYLTQFDVSEYV